MEVVLQVQNGRAALSCEGCGFAPRARPLDCAPLIEATANYRKLRDRNEPEGIAAIGATLYAWLDGDAGWMGELRQNLEPPFVLEVRAPLHPNEAERAVLDAPWELLADAQGFLALDQLLRFAP